MLLAPGSVWCAGWCQGFGDAVWGGSVSAAVPSLLLQTQELVTIVPGWARSATNAQLGLGELREVLDVIQPPLCVLGKSLWVQRVTGA